MRTTLLSLLFLLTACGTEGNAPPPATDGGASRGTLRLVMAVEGADVDSTVSAIVADGPGALTRDVRAGVPTDVDVSAGLHSITLADLTPNCSVAQGQSFTADVAAGAVTEARLTVRCDAFAYVVVTAVVTGVQVPTDGLELQCRDIACGSAAFAGGAAVLRMTGGVHIVEFSRPPCNPDPTIIYVGLVGPSLAVTAVAGDTTRVDFPIFCAEDPPLP